MEKQYLLSVDQSTQGTKALLFDQEGNLICRGDRPHRQIINDAGWVSHDLNEIYSNTLKVVRDVIEKAGIRREQVAGLGISNQRETSAVWDRTDGHPLADAIVWQCSRAKDICARVEESGKAEWVRRTTGINLSPYFPASKLAWFMENVKEASQKASEGTLCLGTIDSYLVYRLTGGTSFKTDYSNASRTQLFNIHSLEWDEGLCSLFGIPVNALAQVCDSNAWFGDTDLEGYLDNPIPIHGVLGDSHGALFGQGCLEKGMIKTTYGTGSSIMMNIGEKPVISTHGVVTSLAWGMDGRVNYVLEGNINYTGAVITWLKDDLKLITSASETEGLARQANEDDTTYLVPAFTGIGAPYWDSEARAAIVGITRKTRTPELVKAGLECIAYQIADVVEAMSQDAGVRIEELRVDGGPTRNRYLMQFQSDILDIRVLVPDAEELSGIGAAYAAGLALGFFDRSIFGKMKRSMFEPAMDQDARRQKQDGWRAAVGTVLTRS